MTVNINGVNSPVSIISASRVNNQIKDINDKISAQKSEVVVIKSLLAKNQEEKDIIEQLIKVKKQVYANNEKQIDVTQKLIDTHNQSKSDTEALIEVYIKKIDILEQLRYNNEGLVCSHKEQRGLLIESRDLAIEARDAAIKIISASDKIISASDKIISLHKEQYGTIQKMIGILEYMQARLKQYFDKSEMLSTPELQDLPEITEAKEQVTELANGIVEQYPKEEHSALTQTVKNVVDATFTEIKPTDMKANWELFNNLGKRIEAALDKKHESLAAKLKDTRRTMDIRYYRPLESFSRIGRLAYLNLAIKDMKA